jgi:hypothetical protein
MNDTPSALGSNYEIRVRKVSDDAHIFRYYLQSIARQILSEANEKRRIIMCHRFIAPRQDRAVIRYNPQKRRATFGNLLTCGELWVCPVCASRITEKRAAELIEAAARWRKTHSGQLTLNTYTLQHDKGQTLAEVLGTLQTALRRFKSGRAYQAIQDAFQVAGCVRAIEILYGENGWHAHVHELVFHKRLTPDQRRRYVTECTARWLDCLIKSGGAGLAGIAFDSRAEKRAVADYLAKIGREPIKQTWGLEREISKAPSKVGRSKGRSAFDLLADAGAGDPGATRLYLEYVRNTKGLRFLRWSTGLRDLLDMDNEAPDSEIAATDEAAALVLGYIRADGWRALMRFNRDVRVELLEIARTGDYEAVRLWCLARSIAFEREDTDDAN